MKQDNWLFYAAVVGISASVCYALMPSKVTAILWGGASGFCFTRIILDALVRSFRD
jgi:hypothetical protein